MAHLLRYGTATHGSLLRANPQHNFAHTFAMQIYDSGAIYSMIPKNGCTSLRLSIAIANGVVGDLKHWEWIHQNNDSFRPSLKDLALARYSFTVLRCPYGRIVSCFLDKIRKPGHDATVFLNAADNGLQHASLTFRRFCTEIARPEVFRKNIHWRPQADFLVFANYDDYFCFEEFGRIAPRLEDRIGLRLVDARPLAKHDSSHYRMHPGGPAFADMTIAELNAMLADGLYPDPAKMYDEDLKVLVAKIYAMDFALYDSRFPGRGMFARQEARAAV